MRDPKAAVALYDELLAVAAGQPEALERARRRAAPGRPLRRGGGELPSRACTAEPAYALGHNNLGVALYHRGDAEEAIEAFRVALEAQPTFAKARLNLALLLSKGKRLPARARGVSPACSRRSPRTRRRGTASVSCSSELQQVRGRAQRVRARDPVEPRLRRSALQPELHAVEPRRLRGRAARDEARARARSVLRRAEVRAGDRPRVRGSGPLDSAGSSAPSERTTTSVEDFAFDPRLLDSLFTELAPAIAGDRRAPSDAESYAVSRWRPTICRRASTIARRPRRVARCRAAARAPRA